MTKVMSRARRISSNTGLAVGGQGITMHWNGSTWVTAIAARAGISPASLYQFCRPAIPR